MAATTLNAPTTAYVAPQRGILRRFANAFVNWMVMAGESSSAAAGARRFARLNKMSDVELAKLGLTRDGLIHHCFDARTGY